MLCRARFWLSVLLVCGVAAGATETEVAAQQSKKKRTSSSRISPSEAAKDPNETKDKPPIESDILPTGSYRGTLVSSPNEGSLVRVAVEYQRIRVKPGKQADYDRTQRGITKLLGAAAGSEVLAQTRAQLTPLTRTGKVADWRDRISISGAAGRSARARAEFERLKAHLMELLEVVPDTQTVTFHAAPQSQVRVLRPSEKRELEGSTAESKTAENPKKGQDVLPGHAGAMADLKLGQRILLTLEPSRNERKQKGVAPQSPYKRLVTLIVVEEEPERDSRSK